MHPASICLYLYCIVYANIYTESYTDTLAIYCKISIFRMKGRERERERE